MLTAHDMFWFIRPTLGVIVCFVMSLLCASLISSRDKSEPRDTSTLDEQVIETTRGLVLPCPTIAPDDVVRIQLAGLAEREREGPAGILQCMAFASPGNRTVTGPLERFGRMVRRAPFDVLAHPDAVLVGEPKFIDGNARILVTLVEGTNLRLFVWVLSKQKAVPFSDCWMTEAVFPVQQ